MVSLWRHLACSSTSSIFYELELRSRGLRFRFNILVTILDRRKRLILPNSCVPGIGQGPVYVSYCCESRGITVPILERTLQPERLVPCVSHPTAGLTFEPSAWAPPPAPKPWARPQPCIRTILIKKICA